MTKVDIFSGFLGAGKTTLIKKLLKDGLNGEKLVLIENEFGEIGIDGGFMKDAGIEVTEMNSGCICCSLVGDFGTALKEVVTTYSPERIIIEPSGVGKLSDVIKAVNDVAADAELTVNNFVAVVDAAKCKRYMKGFGEFFNNQIEYAKTIILSRTQTMDEEKLHEVLHLLREHNEKAVIITTPWDDLTSTQILEAMEQENSFEEDLLSQAEICPECGHHHDHDHEHHHEHAYHHHDEHCHHEHHEHDEHCHHDHDHHHADDVFTSWGKETPHKYTENELKVILEELANTENYGTILRAKGIVASDSSDWLHFDLTPGEYEVRHGAADVIGRLCVIGTELDEHKLVELFKLA